MSGPSTPSTYAVCTPRWANQVIAPAATSIPVATSGQDRVAYARQRNAPLVQQLVERAQAAGQLRTDLRPTDIPFIVFLLAEATQLAHSACPGIWRRYLTLILDGLRPGREGVTSLPVAAMAPRGDGEEHAAGRPATPLRANAICICKCMYKA